MSNVKVLNQKNKPMDYMLLVTVLILLAIGIIMVLSASAPSALAEEDDSFYYVKKQAEAAVIGIVFMLVLSRIDYKKYEKYFGWCYVASFILLLAVVFMGIGTNGAKRWLNLGISFQPSEIVKILLIVFFAGYYCFIKGNVKSFIKGVAIPVALVGIIDCFLYFDEDHLSCAIVVTLVSLIIMLVAGMKKRYLIIFTIMALTAGFVMIKFGAEFRTNRIEAWLNPWDNKTGYAWQAIQGLYALGSGGLFGVGLGQSTQKYFYIPEPHNDYIFAILGEELGFLGCMFVIILFAIFIWRGILIAMRSKDMFGTLLAIGITSLIGIQAIINIAVVTQVIPVTGMSLPFLSYGGSSLVFLLAAVGILLSVSRYGNNSRE